MSLFPSIFDVKPEDINTTEKRGAYIITVIGCGPEGLVIGTEFADAGFRTILVDPDQSIIKRLTKERFTVAERSTQPKLRNVLRSGKLSATSDLRNAISQSDAIIVTISSGIDEKKKVNHTEVERIFKQVGLSMKKGTVVVYTGIADLGFMENVAEEELTNASGLKTGKDFGLAYSPFRVDKNTPPSIFISNCEFKVAANDRASLDSASALLETIVKRKPQQAMNLKISELAQLFSAARHDANLALANELAIFCEDAKIDFQEIRKLLNPQFSPLTFTPEILGEEADEVNMLLDNAEDVGAKLRFAGLARQINENMVKHAVNLTQSALRSCGRTLGRSKIALLGRTSSGTPGEKYVKALEAKGARTASLDSSTRTPELTNGSQKHKRNPTDLAEGSDCLVFLDRQEIPKELNLKNLKTVMRSPAAIVDLIGVFEPERIETEGFIYRGLGRGTREK